MHRDGLGVEQNYEEAANYYRMAADQGHIAAMFSMAAMYETGEGVAQNYEEAFRWYRLAAGQGHPSSQNNLGLMYESGLGVAVNPLRAYAWLRLASLLATGEERVRFSSNREQMEAQLSAEELTQANALSDRCLESRYRECE
jgi:TPR repeat protein